MNYGKRLKNLRLYEGMSQQDMANFLGIARSSYNQFEKQYDIIPLERLNQIANLFYVSIDYLFGLSKQKQYLNSKSEINKVLCAKRLKLFWKEKKLTQAKLAEKINTVQPVIANYEKGKFLITTSFLYEICRKYQISADYLLGKINEPQELS